MIRRYTRPQLAEIWSEHARFEAMREVEVAACEELEGPSESELEAIRRASFTVEAIAEREKVTDHDVAAFVDVLATSAGPAGAGAACWVGRPGRVVPAPRPSGAPSSAFAEA